MELNEWNKVRAKGDFNEELDYLIYEFQTECEHYENGKQIEGYKTQVQVNLKEGKMYFNIYNDLGDGVYFSDRMDLSSTTMLKGMILNPNDMSTYIDLLERKVVDGRIFVESNVLKEKTPYLWQLIVEKKEITHRTRVRILIETNDYKLEKSCKYIFTVPPL